MSRDELTKLSDSDLATLYIEMASNTSSLRDRVRDEIISRWLYEQGVTEDGN